MWDYSIVEVGALPQYLAASSSWVLERDDDRRQIFVGPGDTRVFVPRSAGSDFEMLTELAVSEISKAEKRPPDEVFVDLLWSRFDKVTVRRNAPSDSLTFSAGVELHEALGDLIVAGARAASEPRSAYTGGRRPRLVDDYFDQVRMLPSAQGSFVVRALLPLNWKSDDPQLDLRLADADVRAVTRMIADASKVAVSAAESVEAGAPMSSWDATVDRGVSSNLCRALTSLVGHGADSADTELGIHWTWAVPASPVEPLVIPSRLADILEAAADYLHGSPAEHDIQVTGLITRLHRESANGPGAFTVKGFEAGADAKVRTLQCSVDEDTYRQAISAHDEGKIVKVAALVRRQPRGVEVLRIEAFQVDEST